MRTDEKTFVMNYKSKPIPFNPAAAEHEAMRRIREFVNRAAAQHLRAMRQGWAKKGAEQ